MPHYFSIQSRRVSKYEVRKILCWHSFVLQEGTSFIYLYLYDEVCLCSAIFLTPIHNMAQASYYRLGLTVSGAQADSPFSYRIISYAWGELSWLLLFAMEDSLRTSLQKAQRTLSFSLALSFKEHIPVHLWKMW